MDVAAVDPSDDDAVPAGTVIDGEYRVDGLLGQGGMGVVHRAFDLRLERPVALKIHRGRGLALERLAREATALARLAHPNVVAVHRVGTHGGRVYVAMELVEGGTARAWARTPRPWRDVLRLYGAAGDGLVAAHAAGLVHRDFKPDNVLVGPDGRPRVADFGLARAMVEPATDTGTGSDPGSGSASASDPDSVSGSVTATGSVSVTEAGPAAAHLMNARTAQDQRPGLDHTLTVTGGRVGTPAFMAPEQLDGGAVDARADQFAFAVSIWEALHGHRPFAGETTAQLRAAMARGELDPRRRDGVPRWLDDVLGRALREDPTRRWPDVAALLAELRDERRLGATIRWHRSRVIVVAAAAAMLGAVAVAFVALAPDPRPHVRTAGATRRLTSIAERKQDPIYVDDRTIAFVANDPATGQYDLWTADRDGGNRRRITSTPEDEYQPRPWPGGGFLVSRHDGDHGAAWRIPATPGQAPQLIADDASYASVSPAGDAIVFFRSRGLEGGPVTLWLRTTAGVERELLAMPAGIATAWSPDGKTIAAAADHQLWLVDVATGRSRKLGEPALNLRSLMWEPRGRALVADGAWAGRTTTWWIPLTGAPRTLGTRDNAYNPSIAPDGNALLFVIEDKRTFLVRSGDGGAVERLPLSTSLDCIDVDRAGTRVAATDWEAGHGDDALAVIVPIDGGERVVLGPGRCPRLSPDGRRAAWQGDGESRPVLVASASGGEPRVLEGVRASAIPAWMPDGRLAVAGEWRGEGGLWLVDADGASAAVKVSAAELTSLAPSPDGTTIAATVVDGTVLVDVASGALTRLTAHHAFESPVLWTDDSRSVEVLVDERRTPALLTVGLDRVEGARRPVPLMADPGLWGTFWVRRLPGDRLLALQTRYDNDLYEAPLR